MNKQITTFGLKISHYLQNNQKDKMTHVTELNLYKLIKVKLILKRIIMNKQITTCGLQRIIMKRQITTCGLQGIMMNKQITTVGLQINPFLQISQKDYNM